MHPKRTTESGQALVLMVVFVVYTLTMFIGSVRDRMVRFERHAHLQAWHFEQLAPDDARGVSMPPADPPHCPVTEHRRGGAAE